MDNLEKGQTLDIGVNWISSPDSVVNLNSRVLDRVDEKIGLVDAILTLESNKHPDAMLIHFSNYIGTYTEVKSILDHYFLNEDDFDFIISQIVDSEKWIKLEKIYINLCNHFHKKVSKEEIVEIITSIRDTSSQFYSIWRDLTNFLDVTDLGIKWEWKNKIESISEEMFNVKTKYILDNFIVLNGQQLISAIFQKTHNGYSLTFTENVWFEKPFDKNLWVRWKFITENPLETFNKASEEFEKKYWYKLEFDSKKWR